jgi:hypothetical protein
MSIIGQIIFILIIIAIPSVAVYVIHKSKIKKEKIAWYKSKKNIVLSILVPRENEKKPVAAEQLFASIHGIFRSENQFQDQVSFEIVSKDKFVQFYVYMPDYLRDFVEGQIYAQYPEVEIYEVPDYTIGNYDNLFCASADLQLAKPDVYSIKTFTNFEVDPLSAITAVMSKVNENEQIWIQMIVRPVSDTWQLKGISHVASVKSGHNPEPFRIGNIFKLFFSLVKQVIKALFSPSSVDEGGGEKKLSSPEEEALKEIERKSTKLGFATRIRIVALAKNQYAATSKLESVVGSFKQYSTTNLNSFKVGKISNSLNTISTYRNRRFYTEGYILNIEELASIYHLPTKSVETPNIVWAGSKKGEPPSNLPVAGTVDEKKLTLLAKTDFRNIEKTFGIKRQDRGLHMYIIGKTGTGKSTLLENMVIDDIEKGQGVAYIDPHGDAIEYILKHIPRDRIEDVIYFNPADKEWPVGFNPLESVDPDLKNIVASGVVGIFKKIFGESWGPRLEYILRNALLACVDYEGSTLLSVMRLLTDKFYRNRVVNNISDPVVKDFFVNEFDKYDPKFQREAIAPIQNKVGQFLSSITIRNIVGQAKSTINLSDVMNTRKILLVDLSVGKIGEDSSALLGAMIITKFQLSAMQRAKIPAEKRKDFYLYVDEFQNFATDSFAVILSEARKYKLNLTMTNQYIAQMPETVAKAIFGNVGSIISFRVGAQDASELVKEFEPVFTANDMVNLNNYNVYVKMAIDGVTRPAFSAITLPPSYKEESVDRDEIINFSRSKYSRNRDEVEEEIINSSQQKVESEYQRKSYDNLTAKNNKEIIASTNPNFYTFVDNQGQKWYIPKVTKDVQVDNFSKKNIDRGKVLDSASQKTFDTDGQSNVDTKTDKSHRGEGKFSSLIKKQLDENIDKDINKVTHKIVNNKTSDDLLVSIEELEKFLSKKSK